MRDIEDIFLDILLPKTKPIFVGIICRPPNSMSFLECFNNHLDEINLDNEVLLLGDFKIFFIMVNILPKKTKLCKIECLVLV